MGGGDECGETKATTAVAIEGTCWWVGEDEDGEIVDFGLVGLDSFGVELVAKMMKKYKNSSKLKRSFQRKLTISVRGLNCKQTHVVS